MWQGISWFHCGGEKSIWINNGCNCPRCYDPFLLKQRCLNSYNTRGVYKGCSSVFMTIISYTYNPSLSHSPHLHLHFGHLAGTGLWSD